MSASADLRLLPVVEFDPFEYRRDRPSPSTPLADAPQEWQRFFEGALADAGIEGLEPLPGTWVVPVDRLEDPGVLARCVAVHLGETDLAVFLATLPGPFDGASGFNREGESIEEYLDPLRGGFALVRGDEVLLAPTCCGDLANWHNWLNVARVETEAGQDVWIGHPLARVSLREGLLHLVGVDEDDQPVGASIPISPAELREAVEAAKIALGGFRDRLRSLLLPPAGPVSDAALAERIAGKLAGLADFALD